MNFIMNLFFGFFFIVLLDRMDPFVTILIDRVCNFNAIEDDLEKKEKTKSMEDKDASYKEKKEIKYEDKYLDKFDKLESIEIPKEELDTFNNKIIMENTPLGNVLMHWDNERETFVYYSDMTIPYRFLEVVARKYVTMNNCKSIYINMNDELNISKKVIEDKRKQEEEKMEDNNTLGNCIDRPKETEEKKSVFAKLKSYNTDNNKSNAILLDSKKAVTNMNTNKSTNVSTKQEKDYILKERSNRYSYEGKMMNFKFLKKVDKKLVDKNYTMSFADFKKLHIIN